ncbi:hypothetical protein ASPCAL01573 [Aspergillus calidoustus]|uniref:IDI-2 n=1 Tax=Aspergillus calidoustus TaxID=454130 RepID=A0A0U5FTT8_ASPCI|nr:hypothetical protein ASPCAL01573 [Aspergillus calidoustus]
MTFRIALISMLMLALSSALSVSSRAAEGGGDPVAECGALGVMTFDPADLPDGVLPSDVRKCRDHPLGRNRSLESGSLAPPAAIKGSLYNSTSDTDTEAEAETDTNRDTTPVETRSDLDLDLDPEVNLNVGTREQAACEWKAEYGCPGSGYCWKTCGKQGEWCWTATKGGIGSWITCSTWRDCGTHTYACARGLSLSFGCSG